MKKINFEENFEIYLFTDSDETMISSKLNEFISYLKCHQSHRPYKFSFVGQVASLIGEITLNQNILMDFSPNSLTESKEIQFFDFLNHSNNLALKLLYQSIVLPHQFPHQSNVQIKKVASLIKALLSDGQFIFLESPETDLSNEFLSLFVTALKEHIKNHQKNIFIYSKDLTFWAPHSQQIVQRGPHYSFVTTPISKISLWEEKRKNFYSTIKPKEQLPSLTFYSNKKSGKTGKGTNEAA